MQCYRAGLKEALNNVPAESLKLVRVLVQHYASEELG